MSSCSCDGFRASFVSTSIYTKLIIIGYLCSYAGLLLGIVSEKKKKTCRLPVICSPSTTFHLIVLSSKFPYGFEVEIWTTEIYQMESLTTLLSLQNTTVVNTIYFDSLTFYHLILYPLAQFPGPKPAPTYNTIKPAIITSRIDNVHLISFK